MPIRPLTSLRALVTAGACALALGSPTAQAAIPGVPEILDFWLVDADTDTRVVKLSDYQSLNLAFMPANLTIEAAADGDTRSVRFTIDNVPGLLHNAAPYAMGPDTSGDFEPVPSLRTPGWITVTATPYSATGGGGTAGPAFTRHLYRLQTDFVVTSTADLSDTLPGDGRCEALQLIQRLATATASTPKGTASAGVGTAAAAAPKDRLTVLQPGNLVRKVCTLRAALEEANAMPGRQTVSLDGRGDKVYRITRGELSVTGPMAIHGHEQPTVDAERRSRLMSIAGPDGSDILVDLIDLDLANGNAGSIDRGGVLHVQHATAQIIRSIIRGGEGNFGGGLYLQSGGNATLTGSIVKGNKAGSPESFGGGGVTQRGGGIFNLEGSVTIRNSAIVDNVAVRGGGVSNFGGLVRIENSSILDNEARSLGGGLENRHNNGKKGRLHISFTTITGNRAGTSTADPPASRVGGGIHNAGWAYMASSVIAQNTEPFGAGNPYSSPDCYSPTVHDFKSYRHNVVGILNGNCQLGDYSWGGGFGIQSGTDLAPLSPALAPRSASPLPNRVPLSGSPLVDAGAGAGAIYPCPSVDSRGRPRPVGAACDVGAVERQ